MRKNDLIRLFNRARDIPLRMPESSRDKDSRCWGKNRRLYEKLEAEGYCARFRVCEFAWGEQGLPAEILALCPFRGDNHLFIEVKLGKGWVALDCSNDGKLPEHNEWDGRTDCRIEVKHSRIFPPEESARIEKAEPELYRKNLKEYGKFFRALNGFLESLRK